ncbi:sodium-coupled neutral amino acid transporter 9 homolog isoform X2 [Galleria mellonella]|nr:sodium-coupled neutral amino acid transporter 9 homolog isoform X2 [Galleria mellonella]XP_052751074.1 sodium-coupled neutral amino acid transporter 9 homolog isoform X2 [Galleria mellonella]XP_052751075.1 sodium-coupled neutral amino acid transporter 9 homolog isoform X2 [Galleria mellonella]XP_052751077.1 sodium-coupled neutral amino acid transporter 9 homolog isoform X2 [Galleria mellonella]
MDRLETTPLLSTLHSTAYGNLPTNERTGPTSSVIMSSYKRFEKAAKPERKQQSSLVTIFSVWNTIMGSSLLTMAWGVERAGLPVALVLVAFMAALCLYTAYVLLRVNCHHGTATCEVPALCRVLLGRSAEVVAHAFSLIVLLGANIVYWILITNFLYFTVNYFADLPNSNTTVHNTTLLCPSEDGLNGSLIIPEPVATSPYWNLHSTVPVYVAVIVFPLLNFKNVTFFTKFNSLGTLSVAYLVVFVLTKGYTWGIHLNNMVISTQVDKNAAVLSGMLALSFYIHNIIITIMSNNARQDKNGRDLTIAFVLVTLTYTLVGAVFYICFPLAKSCIEDNILNNFEMHDVMTAVARILLLFQVVTVYPLVAFMLRSEAILLLLFEPTRCLTVTINTIIVTMCILVACFCPSIGTIIRYTGAVSGLIHIFTLPSLLQMRSLYIRGKLTWWKTLFYCLIVVFGAVNLLMQFFIDE